MKDRVVTSDGGYPTSCGRLRGVWRARHPDKENTVFAAGASLVIRRSHQELRVVPFIGGILERYILYLDQGSL